MEADIIKKAEKYLTGGIEGISIFISDFLSFHNYQSVKRQFIKKDLIILKKFNDFDSKKLPDILTGIANSLEIKDTDSWSAFHLLPFSTYYDSDYKIASIKFIEQSSLDDYEKDVMISAIKSFQMEINACDLLRDIYEEYPIEEFDNVISYVLNEEIDLEHRLTILSRFISLLNRAIIKNYELLNSRAKPHLKICASIINSKLNEVLANINTNLEFYVLHLNGTYSELLDKKPSKAEILNDLFENDAKLNTYLVYEKKLMERHYINRDNNSWLQTPILFVKFYQFCENKQLFRTAYSNKTKGVKKLRDLYNFREGSSLDKPSKRAKLHRVEGEYFFL